MNYKEKRQLNLRNYILLFVAFIFLFFPLFMIHNSLFAAVSSPDAIAMRVMPNPSHISALRWYEEQNFTGAPQSLVVDGYEAVRDGRTVYVNAANISNNQFYTNIYIISYNQAAENATLDIFGQILTRWKFNTNLNNSDDKKKAAEDTKRLADLAEIKIALENYKNKQGYYPKLASGSYLANKTLSVWPSWQNELGKELATTLLVDPINKLGPCGESRFNETTCWDENKKTFADPNPSNDIFELPEESNVYVYTTDSSGSNYDVCAIMESGYLTDLEQGACLGSEIYRSKNNPPFINCGYLVGSPQEEFKGYVSAYDPDAGDSIVSWKITDQQVAGWQPLELKSTAVAYQKEIYSKKAGDNGNYSFTLEVGDSRGAKTSAICPIIIYEKCFPNCSCAASTCKGSTCPNGCGGTCAGTKNCLDKPPEDKTQVVACTAKPANTEWNTSGTVLQTWDGSSWQPSNTSSYSATAGTCKFKCQAYYSWNGSDCRWSCEYCRITTSSLPDGRVGVSYTAIVTASEKCDNCGGYSWSFLSWSRCHIPPGLTINSSTGVISGTPTEAGSYHVCVVIIFPNNYRVSRGFNVIIDSCETQDPRTCVNQYCKGCNSRLTQVENSAGRSNHKSWKGGEASGTVCCDKEWWIDVRGSAWGSSCNNKGGDLVEGGWYRCP